MAVDTYALTSLANVTAYTGISGADTLLENLINRVSDKIETYCDRHFKSRTFYERHIQASEGSLSLRNYPVSVVSQVRIGGQGALTLANSTSQTTLARCMYGIAPTSDFDMRATTMLLRRVVGATTSDTSIDLTAAAYDTLSELVTYINTLGNGWTATLLSPYSYYPSCDLVPIERRRITESTVTVEIWEDPEDDYEVDRTAGILYFAGPINPSQVFVDYTAGYATIPDDLEQIAIDLVKEVYDAKAKDLGLSSESLGDYSWAAKAKVDLDAEMRQRLSAWRRESF